MTRRAAAGLVRLLPILLIAAAVIIVAGATLLAACGGSSGGAPSEPTATVTVTPSGSGTSQPNQSPSTSPSPPEAETTLRLYFQRGAKLGVAERRIDHTTMPATASLEALLAGPTSDEQAAGLGTTIPPGTRLLRLVVDGGEAAVDLSGEFAAGATDDEMGRRMAEVVFTLTRFRTVRRVALFVDGEPFSLNEAAGPTTKWTRSDFSGYLPNIFVEAPGVGAVLSSPFTLSGTASVFEGSFQARLVDSSGRRIVNVIMQATRGAPGRGRFLREVPFSTSARRGTLIVFDLSMEDGSRQDEVRIPVTFAGD
jgi:hypothetical protein